MYYIDLATAKSEAPVNELIIYIINTTMNINQLTLRYIHETFEGK